MGWATSWPTNIAPPPTAVFDIVELEARRGLLGAPAESGSFLGTAGRVTGRVRMCAGAGKLSRVHDEILCPDWPSFKKAL